MKHRLKRKEIFHINIVEKGNKKKKKKKKKKNNELNITDIKNCTCYHFNDIININDLEFDTNLLDEKPYEKDLNISHCI